MQGKELDYLYKIFENRDKEKYDYILSILDNILKKDSKNIKALFLKSKILLSDRNEKNKSNYSKAIRALDKILKQDKNLQEALTLKARAYFLLEKYDKSTKLCNEIIKVNPENDEIIGLLNSIELKKEVNKKSILNSDISYTVIKIYAILFALIIYFNPLSETMTCNSQYMCKIEHNFAFGLKYKNIIYLDANSEFLPEYQNLYLFNRAKINIKDRLQKTQSPFIQAFYFKNNETEKFIKENKDRFEKYKTNPSIGYNVVQNNPNRFFIFLALLHIVAFLYLYILKK